MLHGDTKPQKKKLPEWAIRARALSTLEEQLMLDMDVEKKIHGAQAHPSHAIHCKGHELARHGSFR